MKTFADHTIISAPLQDVAETIMSEAYLEYRYKTRGVEDFDLALHDTPDSLFAYRLRRVISLSGKVPKVARSLVGESLVLIQTARWEESGDSFVGHFNLSEERFSGGIDVEVTIEAESESECRLSFTGELRVNVPLIGKQIEKLMSDRVSENFLESIEAIHGYIEENKG